MYIRKILSYIYKYRTHGCVSETDTHRSRRLYIESGSRLKKDECVDVCVHRVQVEYAAARSSIQFFSRAKDSRLTAQELIWG